MRGRSWARSLQDVLAWWKKEKSFGWALERDRLMKAVDELPSTWKPAEGDAVEFLRSLHATFRLDGMPVTAADDHR